MQRKQKNIDYYFTYCADSRSVYYDFAIFVDGTDIIKNRI